jgi:hypothetical protein
MDDVQVAAFARAFQAAVLAHDGDGLVSLFRADATIRERNAVVAAGPARVAEWVQACVARRFALDPASLRLTAQGATWAFSDASGCYERTRPGVFSVSRDLGPAGGVVELTLRDGQIDTLTFTYNPEWEAQRLASMAAPVLAAQEAQARQRTMPAPLATPLPLDEPAVAAPPTAPPNTQGRTTPPLAPWVAGAFVGTVMTAFGALRRPSRPRQGHRAKQ